MTTHSRTRSANWNGVNKIRKSLVQVLINFVFLYTNSLYKHLCALFKDYWLPGQSAGERLMRACQEQAELDERRHRMELAEMDNMDDDAQGKSSR